MHALPESGHFTLSVDLFFFLAIPKTSPNKVLILKKGAGAVNIIVSPCGTAGFSLLSRK
jgi:hypothetical protein